MELTVGPCRKKRLLGRSKTTLTTPVQTNTRFIGFNPAIRTCSMQRGAKPTRLRPPRRLRSLISSAQSKQIASSGLPLAFASCKASNKRRNTTCSSHLPFF